jgi:hypothetical protein
MKRPTGFAMCALTIVMVPALTATRMSKALGTHSPRPRRGPVSILALGAICSRRTSPRRTRIAVRGTVCPRDTRAPHRKSAGLFSFCRCYAWRMPRDDGRPEPPMAPSRHCLMLGHRPRCAGAALEVVGLLSLRPDHFSLLALRSARASRKSAGLPPPGRIFVARSRSWRAQWGIFFGRAPCAYEADRTGGLKPR